MSSLVVVAVEVEASDTVRERPLPHNESIQSPIPMVFVERTGWAEITSGCDATETEAREAVSVSGSLSFMLTSGIDGSTGSRGRLRAMGTWSSIASESDSTRDWKFLV